MRKKLNGTLNSSTIKALPRNDSEFPGAITMFLQLKGAQFLLAHHRLKKSLGLYCAREQRIVLRLRSQAHLNGNYVPLKPMSSWLCYNSYRWKGPKSILSLYYYFSVLCVESETELLLPELTTARCVKHFYISLQGNMHKFDFGYHKDRPNRKSRTLKLFLLPLQVAIPVKQFHSLILMYEAWTPIICL